MAPTEDWSAAAAGLQIQIRDMINLLNERKTNAALTKLTEIREALGDIRRHLLYEKREPAYLSAHEENCARP